MRGVRKSRRGTEVRQRTKQVGVRLTPDEHAALADVAAHLGISPAEYLRRMTFGPSVASDDLVGDDR